MAMVSVKPLVLKGAATTLPRFAAIGGTSLLSTARRFSRIDRPLTELEFDSLSTLVEALLLHEHVLLVGDLEERDRDLLLQLQGAMGREAVEVVDEKQLGTLIDLKVIQRLLYLISRESLGSAAPSLTVALLSDRPAPTRATLDHREDLINLFRSAVTASNAERHVDFGRIRQILVQQYDLSLTSDDRAYAVKHLFRFFLHASLATHVQGTVLADGLRRIVLALLRERLQRRVPLTLAKRLYDIANAAFAAAVRPKLSETRVVPSVPLALAYTAIATRSRGDFVSAIALSRQRLAAFRLEAESFQERILEPTASVVETSRLQSELLGSGAEYLGRIVEQLRVTRISPLAFWEKLWAHSIDSLAGVPHASVDGDINVESTVSGTVALSLVRAARKAWVEQRKDNRLAGLLDMVSEVSEQEGLVRHVEGLFAVDSDQAGVGELLTDFSMPGVTGEES